MGLATTPGKDTVNKANAVKIMNTVLRMVFVTAQILF